MCFHILEIKSISISRHPASIDCFLSWQGYIIFSLVGTFSLTVKELEVLLTDLRASGKSRVIQSVHDMSPLLFGRPRSKTRPEPSNATGIPGIDCLALQGAHRVGVAEASYGVSRRQTGWAGWRGATSRLILPLALQSSMLLNG